MEGGKEGEREDRGEEEKERGWRRQEVMKDVDKRNMRRKGTKN